jgi:hypothetical protein
MFSKLVAFATLTSSVLAGDTTKPTVESFTYSQSVTAGSKFVATMTAYDASGVDHVIMNIFPTKGIWYPCTSTNLFSLVNGTAVEGTWVYECDISSDTPNGDYGFYYGCYDIYQNEANNRLKKTFTVTGGPAPDYQAPVITKTNYPTEVSAGSTFSILLSVTDNSCGVDNGYMVVRETKGNYIGCTAGEIVLDSGTPTDGVWKASCFIESSAPNGEYYLEIHVNDAQNNPAELTLYHAINVSNGATPDYIAPAIKNIVPSNVHAHRGEIVQISAQVADSASGVNHVKFQAMNQYTSTVICKGDMALKSGDLTSGSWTFDCAIPMTAEYTSYNAQVYAYDNQNNQGYATGVFYVDV